MKIYLHYYCSCLFLRNSTATNLCIYNVSFLTTFFLVACIGTYKVLLASTIGLCIIAIFRYYFNLAIYSPIRQGNHYFCVIFVVMADSNRPRASNSLPRYKATFRPLLWYNSKPFLFQSFCFYGRWLKGIARKSILPIYFF